MNKDKYLTIYQLFLFHDVDKPDFRAVIHHIEGCCDFLLLDNIEKDKYLRGEHKHSLTKYGLTKYIVKQIKTEIKARMFYDNPEDANYGWGIMGHLVDKLSKSITPPDIGQTYDEFDAINGNWDWRFNLQSEYVLIEDKGESDE